jgi:hypothetical protein
MKILLFAGLLAVEAAAQSYTEPPLLIQLRRAGLRDPMPPYPQAKAALDVFTLSSITGPSERWMIEAHNSFAGIEQIYEALRRVNPQDAAEPVSFELLGESRNLVAVYRPGLSYRSDQAIRMFGKARYFYASIYRVRTGTEADFSDLLRRRREGLDYINLDRPDIAYQVISGAPSGTYILLAPLASLTTLDDGMAKRAYHAEPGSSGPRAAAKTADSELSRTHLLFRIEPGMSYVSDEFAAESPDFWRPKR